jgi:hypothetical protein
MVWGGQFVKVRRFIFSALGVDESRGFRPDYTILPCPNFALKPIYYLNDKGRLV